MCWEQEFQISGRELVPCPAGALDPDGPRSLGKPKGSIMQKNPGLCDAVKQLPGKRRRLLLGALGLGGHEKPPASCGRSMAACAMPRAIREDPKAG